MAIFSYYLAWLMMVNALVAEMGDSHFDRRQQANLCLRSLFMTDEGFAYFPFIEAGTNHPDREISFRCRLLLKEYLTLTPKHLSVMPRITMLPYDFDYREEIIDDFSNQAWDLCSSDLAGKTDYERLATKLYLEALLRHGYPRSQAKLILEIMETDELFVEENRPKRWKFPAKFHPMLLR